MFDRIAKRYDFLNHFLSANRDKAWRRKLATFLPDRSNLVALDLASGTADQLLALYDSGRLKSGVGIDLAGEMLEIGRRKITDRGLSGSLSLVRGDAETLPFDKNTYDVASMTFGIRNVTDVQRTLREIYRVLCPGGRTLILEFSLPANPVIRAAYLAYFRHILPRLGSLISGDKEAYAYLNRTVETFPYGDAFCGLLRDAGFANVVSHPLTFGIATIYEGDKS